jgi:hypothetical protein
VRLVGPALERLGQRDALDGHPDPVLGRQDHVAHARRGEYRAGQRRERIKMKTPGCCKIIYISIRYQTAS